MTFSFEVNVLGLYFYLKKKQYIYTHHFLFRSSLLAFIDECKRKKKEKSTSRLLLLAVLPLLFSLPLNRFPESRILHMQFSLSTV
jgi:hypothetical protein